VLRGNPEVWYTAMPDTFMLRLFTHR
jgi:hypothetical protein